MTGPFSLTELAVVLAFSPLLVATAYSDLRRMRIPNVLSLAGLALFGLCWPLLGGDEWLMRAAVAATAFAVCFGLFAIGWFGGGDAKFLPVTMLFVPVDQLSLYMFAFSASMIFGMLGLSAVRGRYAHPEAVWVSMRTGAAFPMGISIAASLPLTATLAFML